MKTREIIKESLTSIVYHYTNLHSAVSILSSGEFQLSSTAGSVEEEWAPKGYHYFMSTTRTKFGGFHDNPGNGAAMFNLDGAYYNARYKAGPVDYWGQRDRSKSFRASESEDRIFSKTPTIPINGVISIHIYIKPMDADERSKWGGGVPGWARKTLLLAKQRGIPAYLYEDESMWRRQDPKGRISVSQSTNLKGPDLYKAPSNRRRSPKRPNWFAPWFELINLDDTKKLGKKSSSYAYDLGYNNPYYTNSLLQSLKVDMANARKPGSGNEREGAIKILNWMGKNNINTLSEFVDAMAKKWSAIKQREQDEYKKREFGSDMSPALNERSGSSLPDLIESEIREGWKDWAKAGALAASLAGGAHAQDFQVVDQIPPEHHLMHLPNGEDIVISNQYNDQQALQIIKQKYPELLQTKQPAPAQQAPTITAQTIEDIKQMVAKPMGKYLMKCAKLHGLAGDELVQFLAQTSHESNEFDKFNENLNYSAERLMQVFPKAFTPKTAKKYAHKPRAIANHVYANVNGNGDEASGDGWKYRGRGFIHLTGRENYQNAAKALNIPLETKPDLASNPQVAAQVALWFWDQHVKPRVSDYSNTQAVTKPINKGLEGLKNRETKFIGLKQLMANRK